MAFLEINTKSDINIIRPGALICFIADYPSMADIQTHQGFSDSAGSTLAQCLGHAGLTMTETSLLFLIPEGCTAPSFTSYWTPKSGFTSKATANFGRLAEAMEKASANVYIPLGDAALSALTGKKGITKWRGSILESISFFNNVKCIPTIDPRTAMRQYLARYFISFDLKRAREESISKEIAPLTRTLLVQPTFAESLAYLQKVREAPKVAVDIEVYNLEVSCISFAISADLCMSIPFDTRWTMQEEMELWLMIGSILEDETIEKKFQNGLFDISFLWAKNKINTKGYISDTMIKHNLNYPDFPKNLGFITSLYTKEPYYKDEGKTWFNDLKGGTGSIDQFYLYNAKDSVVCFEADIPITRELEKFKNTETYEFNRKLLRPILYMMARGILVNEAALAEHRSEARKTRDELQTRLNSKAGFALNVSSPLQCKKFFYETLGYKPQTKKTKDPKTGLRKETISTDDKAMKRLVRLYSSEEAKIVTQIRKFRKLIGTYLEVNYDTDKRLRCSFSIAGTATGRLSSSRTIFGTGTNLQNLPKSFKKFLIADPGCVIIEMDKAQAEWVATAYISGDGRMIEACVNNIDAHIHTANLMFGIPKELISREHEAIETSTDEDWILDQRKKHVPEILNYRNALPNMSCRQAGKRSNHSFNYGLSPQGFAIQYDLELKYAKQCHALYHNAYPGLAIWHQHIITKLGRDRTLENLFGRKRRFLNRWNEDLFKAAYSYIPQSTVGQLLNYAIIETYYQQDQEEFSFLRDWDLLNQVHDSMVFQYPIEQIDNLAKTIKQIQKNMDPKLTVNGREFIIKTDCKIGFNCKDLFNIDLYADESDMVAQLRSVIANKLTPAPTKIDIDTEIDDEEMEDENNQSESEE